MSAGNINITAEEDGSQKKSLGSGRSVVVLYSQQNKRTINGNTEKAMYSVLNNISGIIMIIMIISF